MTIDGIDDNDQIHGYAFQGALRSTLDSLQEFRVITSNANAEAGRSSGAQVTLVTKSGTNNFHGSLYEYNRSSLGEANDWFLKQAELKASQPNIAGHLVRNTFGAAIGGPIKKDRLFFFATYEGQRTRENTIVERYVPSANFRQGLLSYCAAGTTGCPSGGVFTLSRVRSRGPRSQLLDAGGGLSGWYLSSGSGCEPCAIANLSERSVAQLKSVW